MSDEDPYQWLARHFFKTTECPECKAIVPNCFCELRRCRDRYLCGEDRGEDLFALLVYLDIFLPGDGWYWPSKNCKAAHWFTKITGQRLLEIRNEMRGRTLLFELETVFGKFSEQEIKILEGEIINRGACLNPHAHWKVARFYLLRPVLRIVRGLGKRRSRCVICHVKRCDRNWRSWRDQLVYWEETRHYAGSVSLSSWTIFADTCSPECYEKAVIVYRAKKENEHPLCEVCGAQFELAKHESWSYHLTLGRGRPRHNTMNLTTCSSECREKIITQFREEMRWIKIAKQRQKELRQYLRTNHGV
jgi:hypothetical protein